MISDSSEPEPIETDDEHVTDTDSDVDAPPRRKKQKKTKSKPVTEKKENLEEDSKGKQTRFPSSVERDMIR